MLEEDYADTVEHEDGISSTFCETDMLVQNMETLTWLAVNFMPASIEVEEPDRPEIDARGITAWMNDLLAKLHETSNVLREERAINGQLTKGMNALIKNALILALKDGEKTSKELERSVGIAEKQLEPFLKHFEEQGKVAKKAEKYVLQ